LPQLKHKRKQLVYGEETIPARNWRWLSVDVDKTIQKNHRISGKIQVYQPAEPETPRNLDIAFYIMDDYDLIEWLDRRAQQNASFIQPPNPLLKTNRIKTYDWNFVTPSSGHYWLVWDNRYSSFTPKTIYRDAIEEWDETVAGDSVADIVTTSPPIDRSLLEEVTRLVQESKSHLMIVTPYVDMQVMNEIQKKLDEGVAVYIITRPKSDFGGERAKTAFDYLRRSVKGNHRVNSQVHARFIISDYDKVLVSSADLSYDSLVAQYNAGIVCSLPDIVGGMADYFQSIWADSTGG